MKTKILLSTFLMLFCMSYIAAQSHKIGQANYNCKLNKKGWFYNSEKLPCPACEANENKKKNKEKEEEKRKAAQVNAKAKSDKIAADVAFKKQQQEIAKNSKLTEVRVVLPKNLVPDAKTDKGNLKETGVWVDKFAGKGIGYGLVDESLRYTSENEITEGDWKIKPNEDYHLRGRTFRGRYLVIDTGSKYDFHSSCGGNDDDSFNSILIDRKNQVLISALSGDGLILLSEDGPLVLKMFGGYDGGDACSAGIFSITKNQEVYKLPNNFVGDKDYLKSSSFRLIGAAYIDLKGLQYSYSHDFETKVRQEFLEDLKKKISEKKAVGCFMYWTGERLTYNLVFLKADNSVVEENNVIVPER